MEFCEMIQNLKPPVARKLAVRHAKLACLTASFLATGGFKFWIISKCMHGPEACIFKYIIVAAFRIYAQHGEDVAKRGGWKPCIK